MKNKLVFAITISLVAIAAIVAGCTNPTAVPTPTPTAVATPTATPVNGTAPATPFSEADNGKIVEVATGTTFNVSLSENPTTGYLWNVTLTPGLTLVNTTFVVDNNMTGAGGVRTWELMVNNSTDAQNFTAISKRPWEPVFGNETTYVLQIVAPGANILPIDTGVGANIIPVSTNATMYTRANDTQTVTVAKGDTIAVMLRENPSTGYSWQVTSSSGLTVKDLGHVTDPHPAGYVGVGGNRTWEITATGEGDQKFSGVYRQPWMPASVNDTTYTLNVKIS